MTENIKITDNFSQIQSEILANKNYLSGIMDLSDHINKPHLIRRRPKVSPIIQPDINNEIYEAGCLINGDGNNLKEQRAFKEKHFTHQRIMEIIAYRQAKNKSQETTILRNSERVNVDKVIQIKKPNSSFLSSFKFPIYGEDLTLQIYKYIQGEFNIYSATLVEHNDLKYKSCNHTFSKFITSDKSLFRFCPSLILTDPHAIKVENSKLIYCIEIALMNLAPYRSFVIKDGSLIHPRIKPQPIFNELISTGHYFMGVVKNFDSSLCCAYYPEILSGETSDTSYFQDILRPNTRSVWFLLAKPGLGQNLICYFKPPLAYGDPPIQRIEVPVNFYAIRDKLLYVHSCGCAICSDPKEPTCEWINVAELISQQLIPDSEAILVKLETEFLKNKRNLNPTYNQVRFN